MCSRNTSGECLSQLAGVVHLHQMSSSHMCIILMHALIYLFFVLKALYFCTQTHTSQLFCARTKTLGVSLQALLL